MLCIFPKPFYQNCSCLWSCQFLALYSPSHRLHFTSTHNYWSASPKIVSFFLTLFIPTVETFSDFIIVLYFLKYSLCHLFSFCHSSYFFNSYFLFSVLPHHASPLPHTLFQLYHDLLQCKFSSSLSISFQLLYLLLYITTTTPQKLYSSSERLDKSVFAFPPCPPYGNIVALMQLPPHKPLQILYLSTIYIWTLLSPQCTLYHIFGYKIIIYHKSH